MVRQDQEQKPDSAMQWDQGSGFEGVLSLAHGVIRYLQIFKDLSPNASPVLLNLFHTARCFQIRRHLQPSFPPGGSKRGVCHGLWEVQWGDCYLMWVTASDAWVPQETVRRQPVSTANLGM